MWVSQSQWVSQRQCFNVVLLESTTSLNILQTCWFVFPVGVLAGVLRFVACPCWCAAQRVGA